MPENSNSTREIQNEIRHRLTPARYASVAKWLEKIEANDGGIRRWLKNIYGDDPTVCSLTRQELINALQCYGRNFGFDDLVIIVRTPGRINLMGRHADHRGGFNNFIALNRAVIMVAGVRNDDAVAAVSTNPEKFPQQNFSISQILGDAAQISWLDYVNSDRVREHLALTAGNWGNYIKAAATRLQHKFKNKKILGLNIALFGSVPMAAGLSSSSTIVVAAMKAFARLNNIELSDQDFVELCGEGEWFVGSRGGMGDHAAITFSQRGKIIQVGNHPFKLAKTAAIPADYRVLIANSHIKAAKSAGAKHQFNARIASYNLGLALMRKRCPAIDARVAHLRDVNPDTLQCSQADIYRMLLQIPELMSRDDFANALPDCPDLLNVNFSSHDDPGQYIVRGVLLFGIAECIRSAVSIDFVEKGHIDQFGLMMKISHDGDRVARPAPDGSYQPGRPDCSDPALNKLIADLDSGDPDKITRASLIRQPGDYACSTPQIDLMVDTVCAVPGVAGAQMAGAGLGGSIMILAHKDAVKNVHNALTQKYYHPNALEPAVLDCQSVAGAGLADFD